MLFNLIESSVELYSSYLRSYREAAPIHMSNVQCSGTETRLTECPYQPGGTGAVATLNCNCKYI